MEHKAYILRTCDADMRSYGDFRWPTEGIVEAPDWSPEVVCGKGLHGFLWGEGNGQLANWSDDAKWIVAGIEEWVDLEGKVKFPRAEVLFVGSRFEATELIRSLGARGAVIGGTVIGGYGSTVTGGYSSTVTGGDRSTVTGGIGSTVTGGYDSTVTGGDAGTVTGGDCSTVTGGDYSTVTGGNYSTVTGGYGSTLSIKWFDGNRYRIAVAYVGEDGILPNVKYRVEGGKFVEVKDA